MKQTAVEGLTALAWILYNTKQDIIFLSLIKECFNKWVIFPYSEYSNGYNKGMKQVLQKHFWLYGGIL